MNKYPDFSDFNTSFDCGAIQDWDGDEPFMDSFFKYVEEQDSTLKYSEEDFNESGEFIKLRLKAFLARNLWDTSEFYQVYNSTNEILVRAIDILKSEEYNKIDLDN